jgi:hypothetical protein
VDDKPHQVKEKEIEQELEAYKNNMPLQCDKVIIDSFPFANEKGKHGEDS